MKVIVGNPYDYNVISLKNSKYSIGNYGSAEYRELTPSQEAVLNDPLCNFVGKYFGVVNQADWSRYYDKVEEITQWARQKSNSNDINKIIDSISERLNTTPSLNDKRILDFHIQVKLDRVKKIEQDFNGNNEEKGVN